MVWATNWRCESCTRNARPKMMATSEINEKHLRAILMFEEKHVELSLKRKQFGQ